MAHDVFISYSHKDKSVTDAVCSIMEKNKIRCWIAPRDITPGVPFAEAIIDGIKESKVFVLIYSSNSNQSSQVIKEVDRAVHHGIAIIPLRVEDVPMSKQMEYYVSDVHWLDALTPPLEKHINKLCKVVQMLLTMDKVDDDDVEEALNTDSTKRTEPGKSNRRFNPRKLLVPAIVATFIIIFFSIKYFDRQAKIRRARDVALPEIERLIGANDAWRNLVEPYHLAVQAEAILGDDSTLAALMQQCSRSIDILTEPAGASVYFKEYVKPESEWSLLGTTPLIGVRVPIGIFRWKIEKEGYEQVLGAASSWIVGGETELIGGYSIVRTLDQKGKLPEGMVRVPATETEIGTLGDFFIGRYEVTNREFKAFIDDGGYRNRDYWKHPFIKDGVTIQWDKAMETFVDQTGRAGPSTWLGGDYPEDQGDYPVSGVSWYEAEAYAEWTGMSLPTSTHWDVARGGFTPMIQWPQLGGFGIFAPFTNFGGKGTVAVGSMPGFSAYGAYDMAGNVREWCWNESLAGRIIRGGSWEDNTYEFDNLRQAPAMDRSQRNGIRLAFYPQPESIPEVAFAPRQLPVVSNANALKPVSDDIFKVYKEMFAYDPMELNAQVEYRQESPGGWIREKVSFDATYGGERMMGYLFLPVNVSPPYQTVIYFPGSASTWMTSSEQLENYYEFSMFLSYLVRNGRAVLYPIYKGTFERGEPALTAIHPGADSHAYTEFLIRLVKDFRRCVDYLEIRPDIDTSKLAFYGMSWGGVMGAIIPAIEERIGVSILVAGSLGSLNTRPEANAINYVTRVKVPTLMMNGLYDNDFDTRIKPMFDLLGTPIEDKRLIFSETDHIPLRAEYIKETLLWLDKYLGPVR